MRKKLIIGIIVYALFFTIGCDAKSYQTEGTSELVGVSMYAEKSQYASDDSEINVVWKNNTNWELTFGEFFSISKLDGKEWKSVGKTEIAFNTIGYIVSAHNEVKHKYNVRVYSDKLEKGTYRILTDFLDVHSPGNYDTYKLTTNFSVE